MPFDIEPSTNWQAILADQIEECRAYIVEHPEHHATLDFETRSELNVLTVGAWIYSEHHSTEVMTLCWRLPIDPEGEVSTYGKAWPEIGYPERNIPLRLFAWIIAGGLLEAHNAFFERCIWDNICVPCMGWPEVLPNQWRCSASRASMCALPRSLEGAVEAMDLPYKKDVEGKKAMMRLTSPRRILKADKADAKEKGIDWRTLVLWHVDIDDVETMEAYCRADVLAEEMLSRALPPMPQQELTLWLIDQKLNYRGVLIDMELCRVALQLADRIREMMNAELSDLTNGVVERATQRERVKAYVEEQFEIELPDTTAPTLEYFVDKVDMPDTCRRILTLVREVNKTSTSKYAKMIALCAKDGRCHDILMYHGAATGRWAGKGIQVQNFPKGDLWNIDAAVDDILEANIEWIEAVWGPPMAALAGALRGALVPPSGFDYMVADYSAIEARCVLWLADDRSALEVFYSGGDIYCDMATAIYGFEVQKKLHKQERQFGKQAVLGLGYGMGWLKFWMTCRGYNITFEKDKVMEVLGAENYAKVEHWVKNKLCLILGEEYTKPQLAEARKITRQITDEHETVPAVLHELVLMKYTVDLYRRKYGAVKQMWADQEEAAMMAVSEQRTRDNPVVCGKVKWYLSDPIDIDVWNYVPQGKWLLCELPSGRCLFYADAHIKPTKTSWGQIKPSLRYMSVDSQTKRWQRTHTYGGKIVENITQAVARDVMAHAMIVCDAEGTFELVMTVHDEMVTEVEEGYGHEKILVGGKKRPKAEVDFEEIMGDKPVWAKGCPITAEAERMPRYRK